MRHGIAALLKAPYLWLRDAAGEVFFERRYGVRTSGIVELDELGIGGDSRNRYQPAGWLTLRRILPKREVCRHDVFLDFGSGMGRVVLQAMQYPFQRVIGVELSAQLTRLARKNVVGNRSRQRCGEVSLICADALEYEIPNDVTVVFFYNAFTGKIFADVLGRLVESVDRAPRTMRIIYVNPIEEEVLLNSGRVRRVRTLRGLRPTAAWARSNTTRMYVLGPNTSADRLRPRRNNQDAQRLPTAHS